MLPTYREAQRAGSKGGQRRALVIIWATIVVFFIGMFVSARVLLWLG
jgi:hypothetical protein